VSRGRRSGPLAKGQLSPRPSRWRGFGLAFLVSVQPQSFSVKMDDLPIDALELGRIGCPTKQCAELVDTFVDVHARLAHGELRRLDVRRVI
jgi:hypothetical protein